jgi:hypothetical protein
VGRAHDDRVEARELQVPHDLKRFVAIAIEGCIRRRGAVEPLDVVRRDGKFELLYFLHVQVDWTCQPGPCLLAVRDGEIRRKSRTVCTRGTDDIECRLVLPLSDIVPTLDLNCGQ